jgi:transcriptional regulator with XRE-family HTH domain
MTHTSDTRQGFHTNRTATKTRNVRTFSSAAYLTGLMAELDRAAISVRLAESREQAGLTQDEMADLLGVHFRSVQNYESAKVDRIPWDKLDEWARITGRTKEWVLHGNELVSSNGSRPLGADDEALTRHQEVLGRLDAIDQRLRDLATELLPERR